MEGIRRIASAYYERSSEQKKKMAKKFFKDFDSNGDGKISLAEFRTGVPSWLSGEEVFRKLDSNGDGFLDFSDILVLFYEMISLRCNGCRKPIFGPYFCCFLCLDKNADDQYKLCCECYRRGRYQHEHPLINLMDDQYAFKKFNRHAQTQAKSEMEQLGDIAEAHYEAASPKVQKLAKEFFNSMDSDGDGQVDLPEFLSFMRQQGYLQMRNAQFFKLLDKDGDGTLDFWEVMTLYYIVKSRRPFCDWCAEFIPGIFFSCVECYTSNPESSFNLCRRCYQFADCKHNHNGRSHFLDTYTLLQATRAALDKAVGEPMNAQATSSSSQAIVLASNKSKTDVAFKALEVALAIGNLATNLTDLAIAYSKCTIL